MQILPLPWIPMVTLTVVPARFESRATAHLIAFKQSEMMMVGGKPVMANLSTLTRVPPPGGGTKAVALTAIYATFESYLVVSSPFNDQISLSLI